MIWLILFDVSVPVAVCKAAARERRIKKERVRHMEIYLKHPWVVWGLLGPVAFVFIVGTLIFGVISLMPSATVQRLVERYTRKSRV
jgi:hypothetical protein